MPLGGIRVRGWWIGIIPALGIAFAAMMGLPLLIDMVLRATRGDVLPLAIVGGYFAVGLVIYAVYVRSR